MRSVRDETAGYWLERLTEAARSGEVLDLTEGVTESNLLNAATADRWPIERRVPADAIRATVL
jgi:hypothetical protein